MTIRERVIQLANDKDMSQKELAIAINAPVTTVNGWFKNENRSPSAEYLIPICVLFQVSVEWLLTGQNVEIKLDKREEILLDAFRSTDEIGKCRIIQVCMNESDRVVAKNDNREAVTA